MKQKILIADADEIFRTELKTALGNCDEFEVVGIATDGEQAIRMVKDHVPDILVIDLLLTIYDGLTVLEKINEMDLRPAVIASSLFVSDYATAAAMRLRVRYFIKKPYKVDTLVSRMKYVSSQMFCAKNSDGIDRIIAHTLRDIGVPVIEKGYQYLIPAIAIVANNEHALDDISKALYGPIAQYYNTTPARVERAIHIAIEDTWRYNDPDALQLYFDYTDCYLKEDTTNGDFISSLADRIRFQIQIRGIADN